ncbi:MAG: 4Fe-4S dicluster domain-containing protein [Desulfobacterales bacterium]|jgi:heterodisulfide reductase subunit C
MPQKESCLNSAFGFIMKDIAPSVLVPNPKLRRQIEQAVRAESHMCWTCRSCANECPVNLATGRLQPNKIVRLANLGLLDELLGTPEIWYCQQCNRCNQVCPMKVRPADLITYTRNEAARRKLISYETARRHHELYGRFQRAKWHMFLRCLRGESPRFSKTQWYNWLNISIPSSAEKIFFENPSSDNYRLRSSLRQFDSTACFTCGECSSACPVFYERSVFEPQWIFRMANLGLAEELMQSPAIWLCIGCQRCTNACSQLVKGHLIIEHLRQLALSEGFVTKEFLLAWKDYQINIYTLLLDEIDILFGF